ncbi:MAG: hypothetical protein ABSF27_02350 [Candidatus Dormibacteria bacterium]
MADGPTKGKGGRRHRLPTRLWSALGGVIVFLGLAALQASPVLAQPVGSSTPYDGELFALTNQDRVSNGEAALAGNGTLSGIAESSPYYGCSPSPIYGRAADMLTRDYFSHVIPGCSGDGGYVWAIMSADGVDYSSAGENVGWESGYADPAAQVNTDFMASPEHRANILGSFDELGIGSWYDSGSWNYPGSGGGPYSNVYMFAEEFALVGAASAPAPVQTPSSGGSSGSQSAPTPTPTPAPTPAPTPTPTPKPPAPGVGSKEPRLAQGLLAGTIDQVIGSYLDE